MEATKQSKKVCKTRDLSSLLSRFKYHNLSVFESKLPSYSIYGKVIQFGLEFAGL